MWKYNNQEITTIPEGQYGFVYRITNMNGASRSQYLEPFTYEFTYEFTYDETLKMYCCKNDIAIVSILFGKLSIDLLDVNKDIIAVESFIIALINIIYSGGEFNL